MRVVGEELDVGGEGVGGGVVGEPVLDLFGIEVVVEEDAGAGAAEGA
jgi:hypothetical protein